MLSQFVPLGYGSGYGSPIPVDKKAIALRLGFQDTFNNPVHGSSLRGMDDMEVAFLEVKIMTAISRIAQDLISFSSEESGFVSLPQGFTTGSSLMPNKRNPDFLEMLQGYSSEALGKLTTSISILMNKGTGYHREFQLSKDKVIAYTVRIIDILKALKMLFSGIEIESSDRSLRVAHTWSKYVETATGIACL